MMVVRTKMRAVLPPISTKGLTPADVDDLTKNTRDAMLKALVELTDRSSTSISNGSDGSAKSSSVEYGRKQVDGQVQSSL